MIAPGLYPFFRRHLQQGFDDCGLSQPALVDYVSDLLARFARTRAVYAFRHADGRAIETLAGLLTEYLQDPDGSPRSAAPPREQLVLRHLADYSLFMSGLFRDRLRARGQLSYYREQGQSAFASCARFEVRQERACILRNVGRNFQPITDALDRLWHQRLPAVPSGTSPLAALWRA